MARVVLLLSLSALVHCSQVTPIEKVIQLLKRLQKEVEEDGKAEAAAYDKYACFCKEQADDKQYNIEKSDKKIEHLTAKIDKLDADITVLNKDISELSKQISGLEADISAAVEDRNTEHDAYKAKDANVTKAISAVNRAIESMKLSKDDMGGKTNLEALAQVRAYVQMLQPGENFDYQYHSNDIIAVLEKLRKQFIARKDALYQTEFEANAAFDTDKLRMDNEKKFAEKDKLAKEMEEAEKQDRLHAADQEKTEETKMRDADQSFLNVLTAECEEKGRLFDQRSESRAAELKSLAEGIEVLGSSVSTNYAANKKLVGIAIKSTVQVAAVQGHWVWEEEAKTKPASFVQLRGSKRIGSAKEATGRAYKLLQAAADSLKSPILAVAALKMEVSGPDHFVKVRGLVKDLISRLSQQAKAEATQKQFCDEEMEKAISMRDSSQETVEDKTAAISANEAATAKLKQEIAQLSAAIAENAKALSEATELRATEKADNDKTVVDANAGLEGVKQAIQTLNNFYGEAAMLQSRASFVPADSDREGKTVGDRAPEIFDSEYHGKTGESTSIVGILQVIQSDFERTISTVTEAEEDAVTKFDAFKTENEEDTAAKEEEKGTKDDQVTSNEDALVTLKDDKADAVRSLASANKELEKLHSMCVAGDETYEERVGKRTKEIQALKDAQRILEQWQA